MDDQKHQSLTTIYNQTAEQHRYFLSWRQYLLAGCVVINGTLYFVGFELMQDHHPKYGAITLFANCLLSIIFAFMDYRNQKLYHVCQHVAGNIEGELLEGKGLSDGKKEDGLGLFYALDHSLTKKDGAPFSHSELILVVYLVSAIISFVLGVYMLS